MIKEFRRRYNQNFTQQQYEAFLKDIGNAYQHMPSFRLSETPVFIPGPLKNKLIEACSHIFQVIARPDFKQITNDAIKDPSLKVPAEDNNARFLQMDFGITRNADGELYPQLIELQGFPSLYFFQDQLAKSYKKHFDIPEHLTTHPQVGTTEEYLALLKEVIVGNHDPKNVILMDIDPQKQNTYIDFLGTRHHLGIKILCVSELKKRGKQLFYLDEEGKEVKVERIYNRVIFDELDQRDDLESEFDFKDEVDVEWVGHPNWFFRISKYTLPLIDSPYVPRTYYLNELEQYPEDLENYVLKPLYSFAGSGIQLDVTSQELDKINDRQNYILQRKVEYAPVIETPNEPAKCEIRMMMIWGENEPEGKIVNSLVRLSKGRMIGVKYNLDKDWVGASVGFFES